MTCIHSAVPRGSSPSLRSRLEPCACALAWCPVLWISTVGQLSTQAACFGVSSAPLCRNVVQSIAKRRCPTRFLSGCCLVKCHAQRKATNGGSTAGEIVVNPWRHSAHERMRIPHSVTVLAGSSGYPVRATARLHALEVSNPGDLGSSAPIVGYSEAEEP